MGTTSFRDRLRRIINELGIPDHEFAKAGGISKATLSGYFNTERLPKQDTLSLWIECYGIDANWLLTGKGEMFCSRIQNETKDEKSEQEKSLSKTNEDSDPIVRRMKVATELLEKAGASPEKIQDAIMKILETSNETHAETDTNTVETPAFADRCEWSMKRT